ncbi:hypothetical protein BH20ACT16_BH20ACT16_06760 [soil metagenome]
MPDRIRHLPLLCLVLARSWIALSTCGSDNGGDTSSGAGGLRIGTTVAPITSIVSNIGGDRVRITGIVPDGTNSHTFEPKPSVAELLSELDRRRRSRSVWRCSRCSGRLGAASTRRCSAASSAALVIPAAVARMMTNSFARMLQLATVIGAVCGFVGMNLSYHLDVQSGPTIVLVAATLFAAVIVVTGVTGRRRAAAITAQSPLAAR